MTNDSHQPQREREEIDRSLDRALEEWASAKVLTPAESERIRRAALFNPEQFDYAWWRNCLRSLDSLFAITPEVLRATPGLIVPYAEPAGASDHGYRPYLRLQVV
jgi:hypothetical protein